MTFGWGSTEAHNVCGDIGHQAPQRLTGRELQNGAVSPRPEDRQHGANMGLRGIEAAVVVTQRRHQLTVVGSPLPGRVFS
jgi:hypothetical protein